MNYLFTRSNLPVFFLRSDFVTKDDFLKLKEGIYDGIIDIVNMRYYDLEKDKWLPINSKE